MANLITKNTTKEQVREIYRTYPDTAPNGFQGFHASRVDPIYWDISDGVTLLDIGCNSGEFLKRLVTGKKNIRAKGIDISENAVKIAQSKGLDVVLGDSEALPFEDGTFDYVVLMEVLVHVHDPRKMLSEIRRVLKADGTLIGSCPHKNLEMNIWDDARLHHAYYTTDELYDLLKEYFPNVHFKVLKGGQFSMGMANTYLRDKEAEILFKCGSDSMRDWDWQLQETDALRVWMGPTLNPGVTYFRMTGFADKMNAMDRTDVLYHGFKFDNEEGPSEWQNAVIRNKDGKPSNKLMLNQMDGMLKIADLSVWGITAYWDVLAFLHCLKDVYKKPVLTEMDDWIFDLPSHNIASNPYRPNSDKERIAYQQLKLSDAIICSTRFIKENLELLFPGKPVYVIPNAVDFSVWDTMKPNPIVKKEPGRIRIGYTGCLNHGGDLQLVNKPILKLLNEFPNVEFIAVGAMRSGQGVITHDRSYLINHWVAIDNWPAACKGWQIDIGIAPLMDINFNRAKSNLRWLEYSAMKLPTVASHVRPFAESIRPGKDGFLCRSQQSWYNALKELIVNEEKRRAVGETAYERVKTDFNLDVIAKRYKSVLEVIKRERLATLR